jgi:hypothetical protein
MKSMDAYLRLADQCERDAIASRDSRERRQFRLLSRVIRTWAEAEPPTGARPPDAPEPPDRL